MYNSHRYSDANTTACKTYKIQYKQLTDLKSSPYCFRLKRNICFTNRIHYFADANLPETKEKHRINLNESPYSLKQRMLNRKEQTFQDI